MCKPRSLVDEDIPAAVVRVLVFLLVWSRHSVTDCMGMVDTTCVWRICIIWLITSLILWSILVHEGSL